MHNKSELRRYFSEIRKNCSKENEKAIANIFLYCDEYKNAKTIFAYYPFRDEFNTLPIITKALSEGKTLCLPKCDKKTHTMNFYEITSPENDLSTGSYGIPEPIGNIITKKHPDVFIVPALSCDISGNRLGYGGGYYDRYLAKFKDVPKVVLMHENQISKQLPFEETDIPIDIIITEGGYIKTL